MGAIRTQANTVFRDFRVDGNRSTGAHPPEKSRIRALFGIVEDAIGSGGGSGGSIIDPVERPGDAPDAFTSTLAGDGADLLSLAVGTPANDNEGAVRRVVGAATIASRQNLPIEAGVVYGARWSARRNNNPSDPLGDTVEFGIAWLDNAKAYISSTVVFSGSVSTTDGVKTVQRTLSLDQAADITIPPTARYRRPYIRTYGDTTGVTDIEVIRSWETSGLPGPKGDDGDLTAEAEAIRDELLVMESNIEDINDALMAVGRIWYAADRAALKAFDTTQSDLAYLGEGTRVGLFRWTSGDFSAQVTADPGEGLYIKATAIASSSGAWVRANFYAMDASPLWWGCTLDGTASDTAFGQFIDAIANIGLKGMLPAGTITLGAPVTRNLGAKPFVLHGMGFDVSTLKFTGGSGGFALTVTNLTGDTALQRNIEARHFSLHTTQAGGGTAFQIQVSPTLPSSTARGGHIELSIRGSAPTTAWWTDGIYVIDGWNFLIEDCVIKGQDDVSYPFNMASGIKLLRCNDPRIVRCYAYHMNYALQHGSDTGSYGDGTEVTGCTFVGIGVGIYSNSSVQFVFNSIHDNHINAYINGISLNNCWSTPITNNLIFKVHLSTQNNWGGIAITNGNSNRIIANQISSPGAPGGVTNFCIIISPGDESIIEANQFRVMTGTTYGVYLGGNKNAVRNNVSDTTITVPAVVASGTGNTFSGNSPGGLFQLWTAGDVSPSVTNDLSGLWSTNNASSTTVTTLDDMADGQRVVVQINDANTGWTHQSVTPAVKLYLKGAVNITVGTGVGGFIEFVRRGGTIYETSRSF